MVRGPGRKLDPRRQCLPEELRRASRHRRPLRRRRRPLRHQPRHPDSDGDGLLDGDEDREKDGPTNQDECDGGSDPADNNDLPGADPPPPPPTDADEHGLSDEAEPTSIALTAGQTRCWFPRAAELGGAPPGFAGRGAGLHQTRRENANHDRAPRDPGESATPTPQTLIATVTGSATALRSSATPRPSIPSSPAPERSCACASPGAGCCLLVLAGA